MNRVIKIFRSPDELAKSFAGEMVSEINNAGSKGEKFTIALSGGSTPELLFSILGDHYSDSVKWNSVHFFWSDERCVSADDPESNFGMVKNKLFDKINIPADNIHRIKGEENPEKEALRYSDEIRMFTRTRDGLPLFDLVILGLGEDGHTASIFPGNTELFSSMKICEAAVHPVSNQKRITITGRIINNSDSVVFLVTGNKKAAIIERILNKCKGPRNFPAELVVPEYGRLHWLIDRDAASLL